MKYVVFLILVMLGCSHQQATTQKQTNVFIHGSHFDANVWASILVNFSNYTNMAINLKGRLDTEHVGLTDMARDVCNKIPFSSNLIVHSFGGAVATQMIGICPKKLNKIIYISALVPANGEQAFDKLSKAEQKYYEKVVHFHKDRIRPKGLQTVLKTLDPEIREPMKYGSKIYSESYKPGEDIITYDITSFQRIPKYYIFTTKDQLLRMTTQSMYAARLDAAKTTSIATGHLPMLSSPTQLTAAIKSFL